MHIPKINTETDQDKIVAFMKQFSFAAVITSKDNIPSATHLPFLVTRRNNDIILTAHFAKANEQWKDISNENVLVVFMEPHAYISPKNYTEHPAVPTWNYIAVHACGKGVLITEMDKIHEVLDKTIDNYEPSYRRHWESFPDDYKSGMIKGIVAFEIIVTDLRAKKKLSQNRTEAEKDKIIDTLSKSSNTNEVLIASFMKQEKV